MRNSEINKQLSDEVMRSIVIMTEECAEMFSRCSREDMVRMVEGLKADPEGFVGSCDKKVLHWAMLFAVRFELVRHGADILQQGD